MIKFILEAAFIIFHSVKGFPGGSDSKESACSVGNLGSMPALGRSPGGRLSVTTVCIQGMIVRLGIR